MKMVKSLLLASAAGLAAASGAQAADLPVKAAPVEYVKVCSLYGEGFFYIPGTDTCLKIGGWVRVESYVGAGGSHAIYTNGAAARNDRIDTADFQQRARTVMSLDARTQTEYGTLRSYARFGFDHTTGQPGTGLLYVERAFIQFAGFTAGKTQSFFDFFAGVFSYGQCYTGGCGGSSTGAGGVLLWAYTAQFGNGFSMTVSAEQNNDRRNAVWDAGNSLDTLTIGAFPGPSISSGSAVTGFCGQGNTQSGCNIGDYAAQSFPDLVVNFRVDQAWGSAQVAGALHQVRAGYYGLNTTGVPGAAGGSQVAPPDQWGWAAMAGVVFNIPWNTGDKFWIEGTYAKGAPSYTGLASNGLNSFFNRFNGRNVAAAWALDGVFCGANNTNTAPCSGLAGGLGATSGLILSQTWTVGAAIEHYWTPALRTALWGNYSSWDPTAGGNALMCASPASPVRTFQGVAPNGRVALPGCDFAFNNWGAGVRTIWNPVRNLDIGLEVMYTKIETNFDPGLVVLNFAGAGGRPAGLYAPSSEEAWSGIIRLQRNFWP